MDYKVAAIPGLGILRRRSRSARSLRFCFAKRDATLDAALDRLAGALKRARVAVTSS